jgi:hypothetical protein
VSRNRIFLVCIVFLLAALCYAGMRFFLEIGDKTLGDRRGSVSEAHSRADGFYVGTYIPSKRLVALDTPSALPIPDAWVEHAWKRELSLFLRETKRVTDGYYIYIPIPADESPGGREPIWKFGFTVELAQGDEAHRSYRGTGFDSGLGFVIFVDSLPEILTFAIKQKQNGAGDKNDVIITDSIDFKRAF